MVLGGLADLLWPSRKPKAGDPTANSLHVPHRGTEREAEDRTGAALGHQEPWRLRGTTQGQGLRTGGKGVGWEQFPTCPDSF